MSKKTRTHQQALQKKGALQKLPAPANGKVPEGAIPCTAQQQLATQLLLARQQIRQQNTRIAGLELQLANLNNQLLGAQNREAEAADVALRVKHGLPAGDFELRDDTEDPAKLWLIVKAGPLPGPPAEPIPEDPPAAPATEDEPATPDDLDEEEWTDPPDSLAEPAGTALAPKEPAQCT